MSTNKKDLPSKKRKKEPIMHMIELQNPQVMSTKIKNLFMQTKRHKNQSISLNQDKNNKDQKRK